jgi:LppX_LprAFG lipoprotein
MRRVLPVLLACALLPLAAGCGAEESVRNAVDPVAQAATTTAKERTVQASVNGTILEDGEQFEFSAKGAFDLEADRATMQVKTRIPGLGNVRFDELTDGLTMYLRSDELTTGVIGDKHWIKVDLEKLAGEQGADLGELQQLGSADPTDFLAYLKQVRDVHKLGSEDIDGTPTTHYRATIDLDKVADSAGDAAESVRQLQKLSGQKTIPTDVWIDAQGRARRQSVAYSAQQPVPMRIQFTIDYEKFGVPVDVEAPDDGDTVDLGDIIGG